MFNQAVCGSVAVRDGMFVAQLLLLPPPPHTHLARTSKLLVRY